jgi:LPXTG-motif cell wall-anchored protein
MKYIGQPLATRGTPAPKNEQTCGGGCNSDYYAKFKSVGDSAKDKISRLYNITMRGVTPDQLKNAKTAEEFAALLKKRGYYGAPENQYANGLRAKLLRIQVVEVLTKNKNILLLGLGLLSISAAYYFYKRNK